MVVVSEAVRVSALVSEIVAEVVASGPLLAVTVNQAEPSAPGRWLPRFHVSTPPDGVMPPEAETKVVLPGTDAVSVACGAPPKPMEFQWIL